MKQYSVIHGTTGAHVAGPFDQLGVAAAVAKSLGVHFATTTWIGFNGMPAITCVMQHTPDGFTLRTACLYRTMADKLCEEFGGADMGFVVKSVLLNGELPNVS